MGSGERGERGKYGASVYRGSPARYGIGVVRKCGGNMESPSVKF